MTVFLCALPQEARYLRNLPSISNGNDRLVCSGVGPRNAERATRDLLAAGHPSLVVSAGVAGGLNPSLKIGDVILAGSIIDEASGQRFHPRADFTGHGLRFTFLSVSRMITSTADKRSLAAKYGADAVDMESAAIAKVCAEKGVPFAVVRAISDTAEEALPQAIASFFGADGRLRVGRVVAALARNPALVKALRRLQAQTARAGESLRSFLETNPV